MDVSIAHIQCSHCVETAPQHEISGVEFKCPNCEELICRECAQDASLWCIDWAKYA